MKKIIILLLAVSPSLLNAQNVAINNDGSLPDQTALLDIKSSTKGILIPRITSSERTSIVSPALGLTVFDKETFSYWMYRGDVMGGWAEMQHSFQKNWDVSGNNIFTLNTGNIGMGTNTPSEKLSINATNPAIQFMNAGSAKGFLQANGNDMRLGTYVSNTTGKLILGTKAVDRMWIDESGFVGIGTSNPSSLLTINGINSILQMRTGDINKGFLQVSGNDFNVGTNSTNTAGNLVFQTKAIDRMLINENGLVGIGTVTPSSVLTINGTNPIVQLRNADVDKGFMQLVNDDIKIGTNSSNTTGRFFVRTGGADRVVVNYDGKVGIGTSSPQAQLSINGSIPKIDFRIADTRYAYIGVEGVNEDLVIQRDDRVGKVILKNGTGFAVYLHDNGYFNYGSGLNPAGYPFSVTSKVLATEFVTLAVVNWPDYVFAKDYKLKPLSEIKSFIDKNKHLPNIPPAADMEKTGIQLGEMCKRLLEKVEELTLYIIDQQGQIDGLKKNK